MRPWSQTTILAGLLALSACASSRNTAHEHRPSTPIVLASASAPHPGAHPPARPPASATQATPTPDLTTPRSAQERLAQAHDDDRWNSAPLTSTLSVDDILQPRRPQSREVLDRQIMLLKRLITSTETSAPEYPELLFRLAQFYIDRQALFDAQAAQLDVELDAARVRGNAVQDKQLQQRQLKLSRLAKKSAGDAAKVFRALVSHKQFARYARMDETLFHYGIVLRSIDRANEMREAYLRLIREFPNSRFIAHAYANFADYYRDQGEHPNAIKLYAKIEILRGDDVRAYALLQRAWCTLALSLEEQPEMSESSIDMFIDAMEFVRTHDVPIADALLLDAQRGLVEAYAHVGKPHAAWSFFEQVTASNGPDALRTSIEDLGRAYFRAHRYRESVQVHQQLLAHHPDDPRACEWQWWVFLSTLSEDDLRRPLEERTRLQLYQQSMVGQAHQSAMQCRDRVRDAERVMLGADHPPRRDGPLVTPSTSY